MGKASVTPVTSRTNIKMEVQGNKLVVTIDLAYAGELSASKKNLLIASTGGNRSLPFPGHEDVQLGINCYRPPK